MTSLATRQGAKKFNQALNFDTSSVTSMKDMFRVRVPSTRPLAERLPCVRLAPPPRPPPSHLLQAHTSPRFRMTSLATRQDAKKFNQPLNFDTAKVTTMEVMFEVRALAPNLQPSGFPACG